MKIRGKLSAIWILCSLSSLNFSFAQDLNVGCVSIFTNNAAAFTSKYRMIERAKNTVDMSYFIVEDDFSSSLFFQKLIERIEVARSEKRSFRVRILVDYFMTDLQISFLRFLDSYPEIEVRRYHPPSETWMATMKELGIDGPKFVTGLMSQNSKLLEASLPPDLIALKGSLPHNPEENPTVWLLKVLSVVDKLKAKAPQFYAGFIEFMHRTHHKILIVDGKDFQMGGRNISDEYHASPKDLLIRGNEDDKDADVRIAKRSYAFADIDIATSLSEEYAGPQLRALEESFLRLWQAPHATMDFQYTQNEQIPLTFSSEEKEKQFSGMLLKANQAKHLLDSKDPSVKVLAQTKPLEAKYLENMAITEEYIRILNSLDQGDEALFVNAYFYLENSWKNLNGKVEPNSEPLVRLQKAFLEAGARGADITIQSNSIATTDLNVVNVFSYPLYRKLINAGIKIKELELIEGEDHQGSLHMKSAFVRKKSGESVVLVGSYNLDPRSHLRDTNNVLEVKIPAEQQEAVEQQYKDAISAFKWITVDREKLEDIEAKANAPKSQKLRKNLNPFRAEI